MSDYLAVPADRGDLLFLFIMLSLVMCLLAWGLSKEGE